MKSKKEISTELLNLMLEVTNSQQVRFTSAAELKRLNLFEEEVISYLEEVINKCNDTYKARALALLYRMSDEGEHYEDLDI